MRQKFSRNITPKKVDVLEVEKIVEVNIIKSRVEYVTKITRFSSLEVSTSAVLKRRYHKSAYLKKIH